MPAKIPPCVEWDGVELLCIDLKDEDETWHARALLIEVGEDKWIAATPDLSVEVLDLTNHRVVPLRGGEAVPARIRRDCYLFDPLTEDSKRELRAKAVELAWSMGIAVAPASTSDWRVADTSSDEFGYVVGNDLLRDDDVVIKGERFVQDRGQEWRGGLGPYPAGHGRGAGQMEGVKVVMAFERPDALPRGSGDGRFCFDGP